MRSSARQIVTPRSLLDLQMPESVRIAPDSRRVAFCVTSADWDDGALVSHIYLTAVDSDAEPRQATRSASGEHAPQWSPDGKWLAFLSARDSAEFDGDNADAADEDAGQQVWLLPTDGMGGEAEKLTSAPEGVAAYDWLPDSGGVVYLARAPRPRPLQALHADELDRKNDAVQERSDIRPVQIWAVDVVKKDARLLHAGDPGIGELAVAPDGRLVAFSTNYTGEPNDYHLADVWTVNIDDGALCKLTDGAGGKFHPLWTPNGERVLFFRSRDPELSFSQEQLYSVQSNGGGDLVHETAALPLDLTGWHGAWFDADGALLVSAAQGTITTLWKRDASAAWTCILPDHQHLHDWHAAPNGGVAFVASTLADVPEVLFLPPRKQKPETLTDLNGDWQDKHALGAGEVVRFPSTDGYEIEAVLHLPPFYVEGTRLPLLLHLHGGPHGRATQSLTPYAPELIWAAQGYAVLVPNYRGSEGYGAEFCVASQGDLGGGDYRDCCAAADWAIAEGLADPEKIGVVGASYGGFLVNWAIGHTTRFAAAVSQFGIFNLTTDFSNSQAPRWETEYVGAQPWAAPFLYNRLSPAAYVQNIHTPVLLLHGEGDPNTALVNSQEMYQQLRLLGRTVEFVHFPREGHGFSEPEHRVDEQRRVLAWFDKYLKPSPHGVFRTGDKIVHDGWELTVARATLPTYAGRPDKRSRLLEVVFVLRDVNETARALVVTPADVALTRVRPNAGRPLKPVGVPVDVLGQTVLAEGSVWKFQFAPSADGKGERRLSVPVAVTFRVPRASGTYHFAYKGFPPVAFDVPAAEKDAKKG